jgi:hypothetical protein
MNRRRYWPYNGMKELQEWWVVQDLESEKTDLSENAFPTFDWKYVAKHRTALLRNVT